MFVKGIKRIAVSGQPKRKLGAIQTKIVILSSQRLWGKQKWRDKKRENRGGGNALHGHIEHKAAAQKNRNKTRGGGERTERNKDRRKEGNKECYCLSHPHSHATLTRHTHTPPTHTPPTPLFPYPSTRPAGCAPSVRNDALAAVMVPCGLTNAGLSFSSLSMVPTRTPLSRVANDLVFGTNVGSMSLSFPASKALKAHVCDRSAYSS